jgi:hypothetical protein
LNNAIFFLLFDQKKEFRIILPFGEEFYVSYFSFVRGTIFDLKHQKCENVFIEMKRSR